VPAISPDELVAKLEKVTNKEYSTDQKEAITYGQGPLWITAGPGSGKTEVLVARALKLMICDGVRPDSIILTTFTERAADNLLERIASYLTDLGYSDQIDVTTLRTGTLHSLCNAIMRDHRYPNYIDLELMDENSRMFFLYNQNDIIEHIQEKWDLYESLFPGSRASKEFGPNKWTATTAAANLFDRITEFRVNADAMWKSSNKTARDLAASYGTYRKHLSDLSRCDFSTLQEYFLSFLETSHGKEFLKGDKSRDIPPIRYVLVDEFQDTNPIQEDIYFKMAKATSPNIAVVGDDDQALYRFRGGTVDSLVNFGSRCKTEFGVGPKMVNLHENLRSHPGIVDWFNDYIFKQSAMKAKAVRAEGKRKMVARSRVKGEYPSVCAILEDDVDTAAAKLGDFLLAMKSGKLISDWSNVGFLFRSTRESPYNALPYVQALKSRKIPVYNPRSRALHEDLRVQQLLGTLMTTLDENYQTFEAVTGRVRNTVEKWIEAYQVLLSDREGNEVKKYVSEAHSKIRSLTVKENLNTTVMDVLYRILSLEPFHTLKEDPNYATRFAQITDLVDSFAAFTSQYGVLRGSGTAKGRISFQFMLKFYREFSGFIEEYGLNEAEDPEEIMPKGYLQVMTVHQAKGLEFPVVVVDNLGDPPRVGTDNLTEDFLAEWSPRRVVGTAEERAEQDLIRRFYVAYSRAKNLLILCGKEGTAKKWAMGE
jgi:ATP-dependent DNA helicase UvrD/PcrA